jgi:hypothetical protein
MIKSLSKSISTHGNGARDYDLTESTPESAAQVGHTANTAVYFAAGLSRVVDRMEPPLVFKCRFKAHAYFCAGNLSKTQVYVGVAPIYRGSKSGHMLGHLVTLPVMLASESLATARYCAAIWSFMSFHMFPIFYQQR